MYYSRICREGLKNRINNSFRMEGLGVEICPRGILSRQRECRPFYSEVRVVTVILIHLDLPCDVAFNYLSSGYVCVTSLKCWNFNEKVWKEKFLGSISPEKLVEFRKGNYMRLLLLLLLMLSAGMITCSDLGTFSSSVTFCNTPRWQLLLLQSCTIT
jgi:hypothetical protein